MKPLPPFVIIARWTILIFIVLMVTSKIEHKVSLAVGSHLSPDYAKWISDLHKSADLLKTKDPGAFDCTTTRMGFASMAVYAFASVILAVIIVWWRTNSPSSALQITETNR